jgi:PAS domain-containing protein
MTGIKETSLPPSRSGTSLSGATTLLSPLCLAAQPQLLLRSLGSSSLMMDLFIEALPFDHVFVRDLQGRFLSCSENFRRLGFQEEDEEGFSGLPCHCSSCLLVEESTRQLELLIQRAILSQELQQHSQLWVYFKNDNDNDAAPRRALWDVTLFPIRDMNQMVALGGLIKERFSGDEEMEEGKHEEPYMACNDCQQDQCLQESVRESEERHQTLFENMKQGVVYHAADGSTVAANESALRILGLSMDQMLGKAPMDPQWKFINEDGSTIPVAEYPVVLALSGKPVTNMILGIHTGGKIDNPIHWVQLDAMPRFRPGESKPSKAYTIFTDITESKQIERNLLRAKEKAEEADQLKSAFLATMSHEIRTPLNGIMGHVDLILCNNLAEDCREENLEGLHVAMNSGKLLLSIIQDILDLSKIEAGQLCIEQKSIPIRNMLDTTMKLANAYRIQRKKDRIELVKSIEEGISDRIYGDQVRLQQGK